ncbi:aldehyde dehydrogenase [Methanoculleus taiwanensis]|uniref:Aldehyde dehydrogenase n=1 Tax=Methanoculleus taiwanensis TaxID=1550565 RepID=A0A498GZE2_9EURY|nr:aldehyde dehydrogenase family protein [Methanoculleus taiwanensis]RXE55748.1 aldehyde dehydrogenase [Methanoculleus taiwanensis]
MSDPSPFLVGGVWRGSAETVPVCFPFTGEPVGQVCLAGDADIDDAVRAAVSGFAVTRRLPAHVRSRILYSLADRIEERADELVEALILEAGKTRTLARGEVARAGETIRVAAEEARRIGGEILPLDWSAAGEGYTGYIRRFPLGPVLCITPFNFPLNLACHKVGPAVAAGNSVILKPATKTPLSGLLLGEMLLAAGFPPEAISVLPCSSARAERLAADERIAYVSFTGSPKVGWHLRSIAKKRIGLELGGNAAAIVHEDADIRYAASRITSGGFSNAGQVCISVQRVFVHRRVFPEMLEALLERVSLLKVGDPRESDTDIGPMISAAAAADAAEKVAEAVRGGGRVLHGGSVAGALFSPTVLIETTPAMRVNSTEVFAPVITVTPYDTFDEALAYANDSPFGLQAGVFTRDIRRIMQAFDDLSVGGLLINDIPTFRMDHMPYGGVKASGLGHEGPRYAIEEMTEMRMMVVNMGGSDR